MSQLYDQIAALDNGVADRWKARTHDNAHDKLTPADGDSILSPLLKTEKKEKKASAKITEKQAEAIVAMVERDRTRQGRAGQDSILGQFRRKVSGPRLTASYQRGRVVAHQPIPGYPFENFPAQVLEQRLTMPRTITWPSRTSFSGKKIMVFQTRMADLFVLTKDAANTSPTAI